MNAPAHEHEFEPEYGLPEPLPSNERLLWQGSPSWRGVARDVFHLRPLAVYFAILLVWVGYVAWGETGDAMLTLRRLASVGVLPVIALGLIVLGARLLAQTSVYTLTDKRLVMRVGIVLTVTFNLPLRCIAGVDCRSGDDGLGDIALTLGPQDHIAYLNLWPHARPWHWKQPRPMLRSVPDARRVAETLCEVLSAGSAERTAAVHPLPARAGERVRPERQPSPPNGEPAAA